MTPLDPSICERLTVPEGTRLFGPNEPCTRFIRVVSGSVRVDLIGRSGRPLVLYRIAAEGTCTLTTFCLMSGDSYCAEAWTQERTILEAISATTFRTLMDTDSAFRGQVFADLGGRMASMIERIDTVTSTRVSQRLARTLLDGMHEEGTVATTHHELAAESGTSREVVSRQLAKWERQRLLLRRRGHVHVLNLRRLSELANEGD